MSVELRVGDLFGQGDVQAIGHGVNVDGVMGAGVAAVFKKKFPESHEDYVLACDNGELNPGYVHVFQEGDVLTLNIASQDRPGSNADLHWVREGLQNACEVSLNHGLTSFAIPQIGCGIGGLKWEDVYEVAKSVSEEYGVVIVVVALNRDDFLPVEVD